MDGSFLTAGSVTLQLICASRNTVTGADRGHSVNAGVFTGLACPTVTLFIFLIQVIHICCSIYVFSSYL